MKKHLIRGKVKFNCKLEISENIKGQSIAAADVKGLYCCDREKSMVHVWRRKRGN